MAPRNLSLIKYRQSSTQRAHFAVFVPSAAKVNVGTLIRVVGAPMAGYRLEFKRNYNPTESQEPHTIVPIGETPSQLVVDSTNNARTQDDTRKGPIENVAKSVAPPGISQNFMAPVDGAGSLSSPDFSSSKLSQVHNRRCQE
ncbi:hypothetical protein RBB50_001577 [Rhinocladiella similis]